MKNTDLSELKYACQKFLDDMEYAQYPDEAPEDINDIIDSDLKNIIKLAGYESKKQEFMNFINNRKRIYRNMVDDTRQKIVGGNLIYDVEKEFIELFGEAK